MSLTVDIEKNLGAFRLKVQFETENGILGLLGTSGCGKSLTLKCIAGIEKPDRGRILLDGVTLFDSEKRINLPPQKRQVGYLFQSYALFPNMTVRQNILCGLRREKDKAQKEAQYRSILRLFQLEPLENHRPHQLSGGQSQRVALARIMVSKPKLLLLDEPFSALDSHLRMKLQIELRDLLQQFGGKVIMVSHSRDEAYRMCEHIGVITQGSLTVLKPTKALFANPESVSAAAITGCKNIVPAVKAGDCQVRVPQWGNLLLNTKEPVREGLCAIGIRAHYFNPACPQNRMSVLFEEEMEEPFETVILFRLTSQAEAAPSIWWRIPKDRCPRVFPTELGVSPANILLLYR